MLWKYDESGDLDSETFYMFDTLFEKPKEPLSKGSVLRLGPRKDLRGEAVIVEIFSSESKTIKECDKHDWQENSRLTKVVVDVDGTPFSPLVQCDELIFFGGEVVTKLPAGRFKNLHLCQVEINDDQRLEPRDENIHAVTGSNQPNLCRMEAIPPERNKCWSCGYGPLVCPFCHEHPDLRCPKCRELCIDYGEPQDVPHSEDMIWGQSAPDSGPVVHGRRWNGEDIFRCGAECIASKRLVQFLDEIKAFPFLAVPVRAYLKDCTEQQKNLLEIASGKAK